MRFLLLIFLALTSTLSAEKSVVKSATINQMLFPSKTHSELKEIVLQKAKLEAAKEIFGEFLLSETVMMNGHILKDIIKEKSGGVIHIKGEPLYENGRNLGDIKVTITAYVSDKEMQDVTPQLIVLNNFKYSNSDMPIKKLKLAAEDAFIMKAISTKKPSILEADATEARKLALSVNIREFTFDETTFTYTISGDVEYIPVFLRHADAISNISIDQKVKALNDPSYTPPSEQIKRGFYGEWGGYVMQNSGGNFSVTVNIESNGESNIDYGSLECGGDLIIQSKTSKLVEFREVLTYGKEECEENFSVKLRLKGSKKLLFTTFNKSEKQLSSGTLYRK